MAFQTLLNLDRFYSSKSAEHADRCVSLGSDRGVLKIWLGLIDPYFMFDNPPSFSGMGLSRIPQYGALPRLIASVIIM